MNKSQEAYWKKNFNDKNIIKASDDLQINIARTKKGKRVDNEIWNKTLLYIINTLKIDSKTVLLELCCGNGVIIGELSKYCLDAYGVDYSQELLKQLNENYKRDNLNIEHFDVNLYKVDQRKFDSIIIYFSIQHFNERDTFLLVEKCIKALKPNGKILIGDIPDLDKKWEYINKPAYHIDYFKRVVNSNPKIGYWFQKKFFLAMNSCFFDVNFKILKQPDFQINSDHCFDVLIEKK